MSEAAQAPVAQVATAMPATPANSNVKFDRPPELRSAAAFAAAKAAPAPEAAPAAPAAEAPQAEQPRDEAGRYAGNPNVPSINHLRIVRPEPQAALQQAPESPEDIMARALTRSLRESGLVAPPPPPPQPVVPDPNEDPFAFMEWQKSQIDELRQMVGQVASKSSETERLAMQIEQERRSRMESDLRTHMKSVYDNHAQILGVRLPKEDLDTLTQQWAAEPGLRGLDEFLLEWRDRSRRIAGYVPPMPPKTVTSTVGVQTTATDSTVSRSAAIEDVMKNARNMSTKDAAAKLRELFPKG